MEGFLPVVAPASAVPRPTHDFYASDEELLFAVAAALNEEYRAVVDAGLHVQIDDAHFAIAYDTMLGDLAAYRTWAELRTEALIRALDGIPPDRARYHVCWGSWNAPHVGDVPLRDAIMHRVALRARRVACSSTGRPAGLVPPVDVGDDGPWH